jgi:hypothetical protein
VVADFNVGGDRIPSPAGDLVVRRSTVDPCRVVVSRPDGSDRCVPKDLLCPYAVAGWSPDGRKVIVMQDVSGFHFRMSAVSVDAPFEVVPIVVRVRVNHPRSAPPRRRLVATPAVLIGRQLEMRLAGIEPATSRSGGARSIP